MSHGIKVRSLHNKSLSSLSSNNNNQVRLGIVIPLANEEKSVEELLTNILEQIDKDDKIFCVFDNANKDKTMEIVENMQNNHPRIKIIWAPENECVVDAYFGGYKEAICNNCKWTLEMDGGFSHNPEEIEDFIKAMEQGYDFAAGSRFLTKSNYKGFGKRYIISKGGTILTNVFLGTKMKDMTSGFECFTNKALRYVLSKGVKSRGHFFQTEIRYRLRNWNWIEIPISYSSPSKRLTIKTIFESLSILWELYKECQNEKQ